jgi:hypothetical protein
VTDRAHQPTPSDAARGAAVDTDEVAVDAEWRKIEAERIAEDREEAGEDVLEAETPPKRWPWWAFAAALAAGLIVAVAINWPGVLSQQSDSGPTPARLEE